MRRGSTYRVQLRPEFGFEAAAGLAGYLSSLGISDFYVSPILQARPGSEHGYDVVDHSRISEDLGGLRGLGALAEGLKEARLGLTVDVVPNHMAIDGRANKWWWDVLENGPSSRYAVYFDIDWPGDGGRPGPSVLMPILGSRYADALQAGEITAERAGGSVIVRYHDHELPVSPRSLHNLFAGVARREGSVELATLAERLAELPHASRTDAIAVMLRHDEKERLREELAELCAKDEELCSVIDQELAALTSDPEAMDDLLHRQSYRLAYWRAAREELDYRRFFNIETLVGLRVQEEQVFVDTHSTLLPLVREGTISGLRIDHIDGLHDPEGYLVRLRDACPNAYIVVEKILEEGEALPPQWPIQGTTGYDFVAAVNNLFVDASGEEAMTHCYVQLTGELGSYRVVAAEAKRHVLVEELAPELERLTRLLVAVCDGHWQQRDRTRGETRQALQEMLTFFPVYRSYVHRDRPVSDSDRQAVAQAVSAAQEGGKGADPQFLQFIGDVLLLRWRGEREVEFAQAFAQVSAPTMAKGIEDTAFYRYNRLVSLNEVGGDPGVFGRPLEDFHRFCQNAAARWPESMITLATHDTKRGPDVRARINLLSEIPGAWESAVTEWLRVTDDHGTEEWPDYNARYLLFQTVVGVWPPDVGRLAAYMDKAAKEAKVYTSWSDPSADYDYALRRFVEGCLGDERFRDLVEGFLREQQIVERGRILSLAQTALLLTCPGVPDIYQGTEVWDDSLVDPDNRRPVDFERMRKLLESLDIAGDPHQADEGAAKMWLISRVLRHRLAAPERYTASGYYPLAVEGPVPDSVVAFARDGVAVVVPRLVTLDDGQRDSTAVTLPPGRWRNLLAEDERPGGGHSAASLLHHFPVAVFAQDDG
jgi:(1->4)-alpha-D-glucan 1-alpha-D-glucosylmutase